MTSYNGANAQTEIRQLLKKINEAWVNGHPEELEEYFHEDMVIAQSGLQAQGTGKKACVDSYKEFITHASILGLKESDHHIGVWGDTAVASYKFELEYEINGAKHHDSGVDLFIFTRQRGNWRAVWRTILPLP